ncbi:MAG TPA: arylamine N-acetyltransferase [Candidatus Solibacter sp.]|nr:arylamine N-acetyltransferase [Candidatus Solibacter sp.]
MTRLTDSRVAEYLARIGQHAPSQPDLAALRELQRSHLISVPFENLSIHLGEPISLSPEELLEKLIDRRRGGFCYELNGAFALLLTALGYEVKMLQAQPFGPDGPGPPFDHLALRVELDEPWLVDVGFGSFSTFPLRLGSREDQPDPAGVFRLSDFDFGDLDVSQDGKAQYRLDLRPRRIDEFEPMCWWQQTSPQSHFRQSLVCTMLTAQGRVTLSGDRLIETVGAQRSESTLESDDLILDAYQRLFGIHLDRVPVALEPDQ